MRGFSRALQLTRQWFKIAFRWAQPSYSSVTPLNEDEWRRQHDEISQTIRRTISALIVSCLFCLLTLGAPDANLISADAQITKITIPVANTEVSYTGFLLFGPLFLIGLTFYLHIFVEQLLHLGPSNGQHTLPFFFNLPQPGARLLSSLVFYWMVPGVLAVFTWKGSPRPEAPLLVVLTVTTAAIMLALQIRRFRMGRSLPLTLRARILLRTLWLLWAVLVGFLILQLAWFAWLLFLQPAVTQPADSSEQGVVPKNSFREHSLLLPVRKLQLYGASLNNRNQRGLNARYADLRKANLRETDLEGAILWGADLRKADLTGANLIDVDLQQADLRGAILSQANLRRTNLRGAKIDDDTKIDMKWKRVWCIVNDRVNHQCLGSPDLAWADLSGADLRGVKLSDIKMIGADLSDADLRKAVLRGADLRLANLRRTDLPPAIETTANLAGALFKDAEPASQTVTLVLLVNRTTDSCLEAPVPPNDERLVSIAPSTGCKTSPEPRHQWKVKRISPEYVTFESMLLRSDDKPACLDGTGFTANEVKVHMWECNPDYDNQHWKIRLVDNVYVLQSKKDTDFCLDSTGKREGGRNPYLRECNKSAHDQHWRVIFQ